MAIEFKSSQRFASLGNLRRMACASQGLIHIPKDLADLNPRLFCVHHQLVFLRKCQKMPMLRDIWDTMDGRNPKNYLGWLKPYKHLMGYTTYQLMQDFFHLLYGFVPTWATLILASKSRAKKCRPWIILIHMFDRLSHLPGLVNVNINYGKSTCLMGKSTISMTIFNSYVSHYQAG